jgi:hypothetical protein
MNSPAGDQRDPLEQVAADLDRHAVTAGWDAPPRLYALVPADVLVATEPSLRDREDLVGAPPGALAPVEQSRLPQAETLYGALARIVWPEQVAGAALVVERVILPAGAEQAMPADPGEQQAWLAGQAGRDDVRITVAVLRDGRAATVVRLRSHDDDTQVLRGPDLVPDLTRALAATLRP